MKLKAWKSSSGLWYHWSWRLSFCCYRCCYIFPRLCAIQKGTLQVTTIPNLYELFLTLILCPIPLNITQTDLFSRDFRIHCIAFLPFIFSQPCTQDGSFFHNILSSSHHPPSPGHITILFMGRFCRYLCVVDCVYASGNDVSKCCYGSDGVFDSVTLTPCNHRSHPDYPATTIFTHSWILVNVL